MIYIKRVLNAEKTRNIGLTNEAAAFFFQCSSDSKVLEFVTDGKVLTGKISHSGNSGTIVGDIFSYVRDNADINDIIVFVSKSKGQYDCEIVKQGTSNFWIYDKLLQLHGKGAGEHTIVSTENLGILSILLQGIPLQQIFYGAPGTGKSYEVNRLTKGCDVIRTTFHPDSDYSTFVGAYKPTTLEVPVTTVIGTKAALVDDIDGKPMMEKKIIYEFVEQAFLRAYIQAWKKYADNSNEPKKQFLVIEEINRGNCAQIFGDLFQLLDRNDNGFSVYPIYADKDMQKQLANAFKKDGNTMSIKDSDTINALYKGEDVVSKVLSGEILLLPNNLYIWATMNTSDQSLFPIDSAFKRRWDWKYVPIGKGYDQNGHEIKWAIEGNTQKYSWWSFLEKINAQIGATTQSEDKKLGFFFCKATDGTISAEKFVSKVIFYLWNDVFKNNGFEDAIFRDKDGTELSFGKFYESDTNGKAIVNKEKVEQFLNNLEVEIAGDLDENIYNDDIDANDQHKESLIAITLNNERLSTENYTQFNLYLQAIQKIGVAKCGQIIEKMKFRRKGCPMATQSPQDAINNSMYSYEQIDGWYFIKGAKIYTLIRILEELKTTCNLDLVIEYK